MEKTQVITKYKMYLGGEWVESSSKEFFQVINPVTEEGIAEVPKGTIEDVNKAVEAASKAFCTWGSLTPAERSALLFKLADCLESHIEELAT